MSRWQDEVTQAEWEAWQSVSRRAAHGRNGNSINTSQDLSSLVLEKLLKAESRPENVEAWIRLVTRTTFIDLWRARSGIQKEDITGFNKVEDPIFSRAVKVSLLGPKSAYIIRESVEEVLSLLSEKHQRLVLMVAAGFSSQEIADDLGYASPQAVANQMRRIKKEMKDRFEGSGF